MPSFSKILCETDVNKQMAVNSDFVRHLPKSRGGETVSFPVVDVSSGRTWQFGYYLAGRLRSGRTWQFGYCLARRDGHPKPVFRGQWHDYRRNRGLKVGDKITFSADGGNYSIRAERKLKLLGQDIWYSDF